jgi:hypothetical protein
MKTIIRRLHRLESVVAIVAKGPSIAEAILAARRRRGVPDEPRLPVDYTGCHTIADSILRARQASMRCQLTKGPGPG